VSRSGEGQSFGFEGGFVKGSCSQGVVRPTGNNQNGVPDPLPRWGPGHFAEGFASCRAIVPLPSVKIYQTSISQIAVQLSAAASAFCSTAWLPVCRHVSEDLASMK
jgi:hypothetical protein